MTMALQWLTFWVFIALALLCLYVMRRNRWARAMALGWLAVAVNTAALYAVAFLLWPDRVGPVETLVWSVAVRLQVAFTAGWQLWAYARGRL